MDLMHSLVPHAALPDYRFRGMHLKMSAVHVPSDISGVMIPECRRVQRLVFYAWRNISLYMISFDI